MPEKPPDRRVRRTRRRLKEAILELIEHRDYERITIDDITARADVARSTFYSHFDSKEALLFTGFDSWLLGLAGGGPEPAAGNAGKERDGCEDPGAQHASRRFRFSLPLLRHMATQGRFVRVLLLASGGRLRRRVTALVAQAIRRELAAYPEEDGATHLLGDLTPDRLRNAQASMLAAAFLGLAAWWLTAGKGLDPESVDAIFQRTAGAVA